MKELEIREERRVPSNSIIEMLVISDAVSAKHNMEIETTLMHSIVGIKPWELTLPYIKGALVDISPSSNLYITDPYIFAPAQIPETKYVECLLSLFEGVAFDNVYFVTPKRSSHFKNDIFDEFSAQYNNSERTAHLINCDYFHDRFWVSSEHGAFSIGCSLNGLGKKICVLNKLSVQDYAFVLQELKDKCEIDSISHF